MKDTIMKLLLDHVSLSDLPNILRSACTMWCHWLHVPLQIWILNHHLREGCEKKPEKMWSFAKLGGGGVSEGSKMPNLYFGKVFFQLACRIILGPPKHVLHLVWSCLNIYLALKTTLKVSVFEKNVCYSGQLWQKKIPSKMEVASPP